MTGFLLDTCALSEPLKPAPSLRYTHWLKDVDEDNLYTSCLALGEIKKGSDLQPEARKRRRLQDWLTVLSDEFGERVLGIDAETAMIWGRLMADGQKAGKTPPAVDTLIAAQCLHSQLTLVTRNVQDFKHFPGLDVLCPW